MLEFAMEQLWEKRSRGEPAELTFEAYTQIGKLAGAIATHAQSVYENRLTQDERDKLPGLFRKLVNAGASSKEDTRRRVRLQELDATTRSAASKLADERLLIIGSRDMSTNGEVDSRHDNGDDAARFQDSRADSKSNRDRQTVEVAHEELLRRWTLLVKWIDEDRKFLQWRTRLVPLIREFKQEPKLALLRGGQLQEANKFLPERRNELNDEECQFVDASYRALNRRRWSRWSSVAIAIFFVTSISWYQISLNRQNQAEVTVNNLISFPAAKVGENLQQLKPYQGLVESQLAKAFDNEDYERTQRLHAAYGLAQCDQAEEKHAKFLLRSTTDPDLPLAEVPFILSALEYWQPNRLEKLIAESINGLQSGNYSAAYQDTCQNRLIAVSLALGITAHAKQVCKLAADPSQRTSFIHGFKDFPVGISRVAKEFDANDAPEIPEVRSALLLAYGQIPRPEIPPDVFRQVPEIYESDADAGVHAAADWALRQWGQKLPELEKSKTLPNNRDWHVNSQGITMVRLRAGEFQMGLAER